ncbi:MAG: threonine/serine exporter family protein [Clostridium sp.]
MTWVIQSVAAFFAIYGFSLILEVPKKYLIFTGLAGGVCWGVYFAVSQSGYSLIAAAFLCSAAVSLLSHIFARVLKAPVTVFLVAGILPSVPGASIYRCVYYMIKGDAVLSNYHLVQTIQIAGAMAMAIFIVDSIFRLIQKNPEES